MSFDAAFTDPRHEPAWTTANIRILRRLIRLSWLLKVPHRLRGDAG
jgi:hypothetical protein